jgi:hypothetical protein
MMGLRCLYLHLLNAGVACRCDSHNSSCEIVFDADAFSALKRQLE